MDSLPEEVYREEKRELMVLLIQLFSYESIVNKICDMQTKQVLPLVCDSGISIYKL